MLIKLAQFRKGAHQRKVGQQRLRVVLPQLHVRVVEQAFQDGTRHVGRLVPGPEEERDEGIDHFFPKLLIEEEQAQHDPDRDEAKDGHRVFDDLENAAKLLDVFLEA